MKFTLLTALLFLSFAFTTGEPKAKLKAKDGVVTVDGAPYVQYEQKKTVRGTQFKDRNGNNLFFVRDEYYDDPVQISKSNPHGRVYYASLIREGSQDVACEVPSSYPKHLARMLLEYEVLDASGNLVEANFQKMVVQVGKTYSVKRRN